MSDQSQKLVPQTSPVTRNAISLPAWLGGHSHSSLPDGLKTNLSGPAPAPASRSRSQARKKAPKTLDISGQSFAGLSPSARLSLSLANRLNQKTDVNGSPEYKLTWKSWVLLSGLRIYALRASARHIGDKGFTGWPSPTTPSGGQTWPEGTTSTGMRPDGTKATVTLENVSRLAPWCSTGGMDLQGSATLTGWPTPDASVMQDGEGLKTWTARRELLRAKKNNGNGCGMPLTIAAQLAPWCSPSSRDWKDTPGMATVATNPDGSVRNRVDQLPRQVQLAPWNSPRGTDGSNGGPNQAGGALSHDAALAGWPSPQAGSPATETYNEAGNCDNSRRTVALATGIVSPSPNCSDGKARRFEPESFPLVDGLSFKLGSGSSFAGKSRSAILRAFGNAIVPEVAAEFIRAYVEVRG